MRRQQLNNYQTACKSRKTQSLKLNHFPLTVPELLEIVHRAHLKFLNHLKPSAIILNTYQVDLNVLSQPEYIKKIVEEVQFLKCLQKIFSILFIDSEVVPLHTSTPVRNNAPPALADIIEMCNHGPRDGPVTVKV